MKHFFTSVALLLISFGATAFAQNQSDSEADRIVGMARQEADAIRNESYASIYDLFNNAERELRHSLELVAGSKQELSVAMNTRRR